MSLTGAAREMLLPHPGSGRSRGGWSGGGGGDFRGRETAKRQEERHQVVSLQMGESCNVILHAQV